MIENNSNESNSIESKEQFLVSVLLSIYNVDEYLEECLDSILVQSYKNLEIVCVDNGSPDKCGDILLKYQRKDPRIKIITLESNRKLCGGRNVGLDNATGDFICFVDPDDWIEKDWVRSMVDAIEQLDPNGEKYNFVMNLNALDFIDEEANRKIGLDYSKSLETGNYTIEDYNQIKFIDIDTCIPIWGRLYRKKFLDKHNIKFLEEFQTDNIPYTLKLLVHMNHFYIISSGKKSDNNFYWRRLFIKDRSLTNLVLFRNVEIPETLSNLYDYLESNNFQNKVKIKFHDLFHLCYARHSDQPRLYSFYRKLMMKMENSIKDNPDLYGPDEVMLCNLLIYSNGFYDFQERLSLSVGKVPSNQIPTEQIITKSTSVVKLFGLIPLYKKKIFPNLTNYYIFGIPFLKIKITDKKYINMYLFNFIRIIKKYTKY